MIYSDEFKTFFYIRLTVFTPSKVVSNSRILKKLFHLVPEDFDADPMVLPLPEDAPHEVPRVTFQNFNKTKFFEIAPKRVNIIFKKNSFAVDISSNEFIKEYTELLTDYLREMSLECVRIALNLSRMAPKENPETELTSHFCKEFFLEEPFDRSSEFQINALKKYTLDKNFSVNSWVKIKSDTLNFESKSFRAIFFEQDLNTLYELIDERSYNYDEICSFFVAAEKDNHLTLSKYFPQSNNG